MRRLAWIIVLLCLLAALGMPWWGIVLILIAAETSARVSRRR